MHSLYIVLFALGIYNSFGLTRPGQTSSKPPCDITLPFTNPHISAFYEKSITGTGCTTNMTTSTNQEVHIINLKKTGPVFRNDIAEVHLFIKSRNDEVLWEPLIIVLNSAEPVKWKVRTEILAPARKKHIFVIPAYSSVKLIKSTSRRTVRKYDQLSQKKEKLYDWVKERFGAVTSFAELDRGNQITLNVGLDKTASSATCELMDGQAKTVEATYEQPKILTGCVVKPKTNVLARVAYVIELDKVSPDSNRQTPVEVELEIKGGSKRTTHRDFWLVLKSPPKVVWKIKTKKLQGYAEIVSNSHIDMTGIKMDPVSDRIEEFSDSGQKFLKWVEIYVGPVAMYAGISLANKIKLVIPDGDGNDRPMLQNHLIPPFENILTTKKAITGNIHTECIGNGAMRVSLSKKVYQMFDHTLDQLSFLNPTCTATQNATHILLESIVGECNTQMVTWEGKPSLHNAIMIHRSDTNALELGSGDAYDDELNSSGSGTYDHVTETHIDDEDYTDVIKIDVSCFIDDKKDQDITVNSSANNPVPSVIPPIPSKSQINKVGDSDISFHVQLFKTPYYLEANYQYPMNVSVKSNVYVDAFIQGDISMRVQIISCQLSKYMDRESQPVKTLIENGCKVPDVTWEPVPTGKPLMGSVTQSQRFSFPLVSLIPYMNQYIFLRCHMTVCKNYDTDKNQHIPQCIDNKKEVCKNGLPITDSSKVPSYIEMVGPMKILDIMPDVIPRITAKPQENEENNIEKQQNDETNENKNLVVDGLESGTVIGIAFAAFFIGVLLMAALWFIHTHTGPIKHAVANSRAGIDGCGESTPMSTAPITITT